MKLNEYFSKLQGETISLKEYCSLKTQCLRLTKKACRRYKIQDLLHNKTLQREVEEDVYIKSLLKVLKSYNKEKSSFTTYFYYKACSAARVEAIKLKNRIQINNTLSLQEDWI